MKPPKPTGICPGCAALVDLNRNGTLRVHAPGTPRGGVVFTHCPGTGTRPTGAFPSYRKPA